METTAIHNPERLENIVEVAEALSRLEKFEQLNNKPAVVVKRQSLSMGASYDIISFEEASKNIGILRGRELYIKYWTKEYFLDLKKKYA